MSVRTETPAERIERERALYVHMVKQGLQMGLSRFYGRAIRVALIYSVEPAQPQDFLVYDTAGLLADHKAAIQAYLNQPGAVPRQQRITNMNDRVEKQPHIDDGLICFVHQSYRFFYHMWLIERPQSESPVSIIDMWVRLAQVHLKYEPGEIQFPSFGASQRATEHAVFDVIREVIMGDNEIYPRTLPGGQGDAELVLESLLEIATVKEEGKGCSGTLALYDRVGRNHKLDQPLVKPVPIDSFKHVRKLLTASSDGYQLVAQNTDIVGMSLSVSLPQTPLLAKFENGRATLFRFEKPLCQLINGHLRAVDSTWSLKFIKEPQILSKLKPATKQEIYKVVDRLVAAARHGRFGCTVLIDCGNAAGRNLTGQQLQVPVPLSESNFKHFEDMCKVDGAVHIDATNLSVPAFGCLLDGDRLADEDLSRGARFNSARRYSNKVHDMLILVVSEDGPVTVFEKGEPTAGVEKYVRDYEYNHAPPTLTEWLAGATHHAIPGVQP